MLQSTEVPRQRKMPNMQLAMINMKLYGNRSQAEASISSSIVKRKENNYA